MTNSQHPETPLTSTDEVKRVIIRVENTDGETRFLPDTLNDMGFNRKYRRHFYLNQFTTTTHQEGAPRLLGGKENLFPRVVNMVVHSLTQWCVTRVPARHVFDRFYQASILAGKGVMGNQCLATLDAAGHTLTPEVVQAAVRLCTTACFATSPVSLRDRYWYRQPDTMTLSHITQMVNRSVSFFLAERIAYVPIGTQTVNPRLHPTKRSDNTLWSLSLTAVRGSGYMDKLSLFLALILLRHEGQDPRRQVNHIGLFNPRYNLSSVMDIRKLDPVIYREISQRIYG